jgi:hypothetical protein
VTLATPELVNALRAAVQAADPAILENVKWNSPNFVYRGADRITLRIHPRSGVQVIFHRGAKVAPDAEAISFYDPTGLLVWKAKDRAVLSVVDEEHAAELLETITTLVRRWIHL